MQKIRATEAPEAIMCEEPFRTHGALSAVAGAVHDTGKLPAEWAQQYREQRLNDNVRYTVLSYDTPIAWTTYDGYLIFPAVRYSVTTSSRHQSKLYKLTNIYGGGDRRRVIREFKNFEAPAMEERAAISRESGEGALYSLEYLQAKMKTPAS